jgi:hypothetical protein
VLTSHSGATGYLQILAIFLPPKSSTTSIEFYNHDAQWLIVSIGESEIDFCFFVLQPITCFQHLHEGISKLKQVTDHCHHDIQQSIIAVSVDAAPPGVLAAVCMLMQFHYLVQALHIDENNLKLISSALDEFHVKKDMIIAAGAHWGHCNKVMCQDRTLGLSDPKGFGLSSYTVPLSRVLPRISRVQR